MNSIQLQEHTDNEHLKLLKIFHYVLAGVSGLFSCSFLFHIYMGWSMMNNHGLFGHAESAPPAEFAWMMMGMGAIALLIGLTYSALLAYAGKCIAARKKRLFVLVTAGLSFFQMPLGLLLGIFTFVVLLRPSVKAMFESTNSQVETPLAQVSPHFDLSSIPDPDEATWLEIEAKAKQNISEAEPISLEKDDAPQVIKLKQHENETLS